MKYRIIEIIEKRSTGYFEVRFKYKFGLFWFKPGNSVLGETNYFRTVEYAKHAIEAMVTRNNTPRTKVVEEGKIQ